MSAERSLEELHGMLQILEQDAAHLRRWNHLDAAQKLFDTLGLDDRQRLVALALSVGSEDVQCVACYLMTRLDPEPGSLQELLRQMSEDEVREIQAAVALSAMEKPKGYLTSADYARVLEEICYAVEELSPKELEEAYWVLIGEDINEDADWIAAMGGNDDTSALIGSSMSVSLHLAPAELRELLADMRQARWILHIHNHPNPSLLGFDAYAEYYESEADLDFARHWKARQPDVGQRMMFFVIRQGVAIQYGLPHGRRWRWV